MTRHPQCGKRLVAALVCLLGGLSGSVSACAQALPTATRTVRLSAFVLSGDVYTGLGGFGAHDGLGGRNIALTVGANVGVHGVGAYRLAAEVRGTYPVISGYVDGQESLLGGLRLQRAFHEHPMLSRLHVYGDVLAGRGELRYVDAYPAGAVLYHRTSSPVYGGGGGLEIDCSYHWAIVGDVQLQHWETPVTKDGGIFTKSGLAGVAYRF